MADLLDKQFISLRITNSVFPGTEGQKPIDKYVASVIYGSLEIPSRSAMTDILNGGESSPTGAVYDLIRVLKELTVTTFAMAKAQGLLTPLSELEDIK